MEYGFSWYLYFAWILSPSRTVITGAICSICLLASWFSQMAVSSIVIFPSTLACFRVLESHLCWRALLGEIFFLGVQVTRSSLFYWQQNRVTMGFDLFGNLLAKQKILWITSSWHLATEHFFNFCSVFTFSSPINKKIIFRSIGAHCCIHWHCNLSSVHYSIREFHSYGLGSKVSSWNNLEFQLPMWQELLHDDH